MLLGLVYAIFAGGIVAYELTRKKRMLFDQLSLLNIFFLAYLAVPPAVLHLILDPGFVGADRVADFTLLTYVYHLAQPTERLILLLGSLLAYCGLTLGYRISSRSSDFSLQRVMTVNFKVRFTWSIIGLVFVALMFAFGNTLSPGDPVEGLLLAVYYRAEDPFYNFERTALNANIYAATTTFLLFSVLGYALSDERRRARFVYLALTLVFLFIDVVAAANRRNLLIAALLIYLYVVVRKGEYKVHYLTLILLVSLPLLYFGKPILRNLSDPDAAERIIEARVPLVAQLVGAAGEYGSSYLESIGTLALYTGGPRFGVDHLLSVLRELPLGMFGIQENWPERIVRISTAYQSGDPWTQDIPPGYLGQCWIDFPFLGFLLVPLLHGMCFGLMERAFRFIDLRKSPFYLMAYLVAGFLVAMPLNTGSLDFTFSPDIFLTVFLFFVLHFINTKHLRLSPVIVKTRPRFITSEDSASGAVVGQVTSENNP